MVIPNYPPMYTKYNPGEGNCFFYALQQGLEKLGITFLNEEDIRENLAAWFQVETNQMQMEALLLVSLVSYETQACIHQLWGGNLILRARVGDGGENMLDNEVPGLELWKYLLLTK